MSTPELRASRPEHRFDVDDATRDAVRERQADGPHPSPPRRPTGRSLVVLDPDDPSGTLRAALRHPDVHDGDLQLLVVFPTSEYEARRRARRDAGLTAPYATYHLEDEARRIAERAGREWIDPSGEAFESVGAVGRLRDWVRMAAGERDYARVYVARPRRTRWQRLFAGVDPAKSLARVLPADVSIVSVDDTDDSVADVADTTAIPDLTAGPETPVRK